MVVEEKTLGQTNAADDATPRRLARTCGPADGVCDPAPRGASKVSSQSGHKMFLCADQFLDSIVSSANQITILGFPYKPYSLMSDIATVSAIIFTWIFARQFPALSGVDLTIVLLASLITYKLMREIKAKLHLGGARSFLQDCLTIIIPTYLLTSFLLGQPMNLVLALLAGLMALSGGLHRIGCFLGGCCYGKPSAFGVRYPDHIFAPASGRLRRYAPSPRPDTRVFPIQLCEATMQLALFALLVSLIWSNPGSAKYLFWAYMASYAIGRFGLDFFRVTSARPRCGIFSEAQVFCVVIVLVGVGVLLHIAL